MAQSRFEFVHEWSAGIAELARILIDKLDPAERGPVEHILTLLDDNNHDLEGYLSGHGIDVAAGSGGVLSFGVAPSGENKWQEQFSTAVVDFAVSDRVDFDVEFANGGFLQYCLGDDPLTGATLVMYAIDTTGFNVRAYVGAVLQTTGLYRVNWRLIGW